MMGTNMVIAIVSIFMVVVVTGGYAVNDRVNWLW
jgi:hypothetical protein